MRASTNFQNRLLNITPFLKVLQFLSRREREFFSILDLSCFIVNSKESDRDEGGGVENSAKLRTEQMSLLTIELRVRVNISVQVSCEDVLDFARRIDVLWSAVWQLNPVIQQVVCDPEDKFIDTLSSRLLSRVLRVLFIL